MKTCLYAGSFDPFTNGHLSIVKEASLIFDKVYVVVASNSEKSRFMNMDYSLVYIQTAINKAGIENVEVLSCDTMVALMCENLGVDYLVRGLRNTTDYMYEENIAKINREINPNLKTIYLRGENDVISSSMVRELLKYGHDVSKYVPTGFYDFVK